MSEYIIALTFDLCLKILGCIKLIKLICLDSWHYKQGHYKSSCHPECLYIA